MPSCSGSRKHPRRAALGRDRQAQAKAIRAEKIGNIVETAATRLIGAVLLEANDEWQLQHRYMGVEALAELLNPNPANENLQLPPRAA